MLNRHSVVSGFRRAAWARWRRRVLLAVAAGRDPVHLGRRETGVDDALRG
ncbi:hypothetical protein [Micromonospora sp. KC723]|nr:hypothetical protein [Micromonospora sp. KC723]